MNTANTAKASEAALEQTTSRLSGIIASAMDAVISTDAGQRIVQFNPAAERLFGVGAREALGQGPDRFRKA